jgi:hypothetical protein
MANVSEREAIIQAILSPITTYNKKQKGEKI